MSAKIIPLQPVRRYASTHRSNLPIAFQRAELGVILNLYGQMVTKGVWKDYAIDMRKNQAVFSVYRRASEMPIYQIFKRPDLRHKQGQYSVVAHGGLILKRGHDLRAVLRVFDKQKLKGS